MIEQQTVIVGNVASAPLPVEGAKTPGTKFRVAHTDRIRDVQTGEWRDGATVFLDVSCWRALAVNVLRSVSLGDPVLVMGRLRDTSYIDRSDVRHQRVEVVADFVGLDLRRGHHPKFQRPVRDGGGPPNEPTPQTSAQGSPSDFRAAPAQEFAADVAAEATAMLRDAELADSAPPF